ncbi:MULTISPECIES: DNA cytosine methyltransferase [unclassified Micromonospora]|uniref:DNA cytosine methyltransferase n=1 Tax=unclassified Micromonospora TaxID=2617518 RepID=UPI00332EA146
MKAAELCAGYSGLYMAMRLAGWPVDLSWVAEVDPDPSKVLGVRHPGVPNIGDISTADFTALEPVDVLAAGFPCTDVSAAGKREGLIGDRVVPAGVMACGCLWGDHQVDSCEAASPGGLVPSHLFDAGLLEEAAIAIADLNRIDRAGDGPPPERIVKGTRTGVWTHVARAIKELRPKIVLLENVRGLLSARAHSDLEPCPWCVGDEPDQPSLRALGAVLGDLADLGYDAVWKGVPAAAVGAPHLRWRVFIVAWPAADSEGVGHRHSGPARIGGVPAATVSGGTQAGELTLLPTPAARDWKSGESNLLDRNARPLNEVVVNLLPTPRTGDTNGAGGHGTGGPDLRTTVSLLPTPNAALGRGTGTPSAQTASDRFAQGKRFLDDAVALLPTPSATDGSKGGPNQRGSSGDLMLPSAVMLLPTPTATPYGNNQSPSAGAAVRPSLDYVARDLLPTPTVADSRNSRNATANRTDVKPTTSIGWTLSDVAHAERWGSYAPAIARWEAVTGRAAPEPTEPGSKGQPRLNPRFVEWLMGLPAGWVTDVLPRNPALKCLGNGVVPQQGARALYELTPHVPALQVGEVAA